MKVTDRKIHELVEEAVEFAYASPVLAHIQLLENEFTNPSSFKIGPDRRHMDTQYSIISNGVICNNRETSKSVEIYSFSEFIGKHWFLLLCTMTTFALNEMLRKEIHICNEAQQVAYRLRYELITNAFTSRVRKKWDRSGDDHGSGCVSMVNKGHGRCGVVYEGKIENDDCKVNWVDLLKYPQNWRPPDLMRESMGKVVSISVKISILKSNWFAVSFVSHVKLATGDVVSYTKALGKWRFTRSIQCLLSDVDPQVLFGALKTVYIPCGFSESRYKQLEDTVCSGVIAGLEFREVFFIGVQRFELSETV